MVWKLSPTQEIIVANISKFNTRKALANALGMEVGTINTHIARIKQKRMWALSVIAKTNRVKKHLYPKRRGE